jgi:peptidyl-Lys metalloendopeptidase
MQQCWILTCIAAVILAVNGHVKDLRVNVIPMQTRFAAAQNVNVILKYSNVGGDTMSIYKWYLPEKGLNDPFFEVTRDGERVQYVGPLVKRRAPTAEDVISLTPGMTLSAVVQLSSVYNMTQSGNYVVQYKMNADQVLFTANDMLTRRFMSSNDGEEFVLQSAPIVVFTAGRRNLLIEQATEYNTQTRVLAPTYTGCSSSRSSSIRSALNAAQMYVNDAVQYLSYQSSATLRYITWFGNHVSNRQLKLKTHFTQIQNVLNNKIISFDCTCPNKDPTVYAYVYADEHYKIYLCNEFWPASSTGTDSKAGTIIHELAHFEIVANTDDYSYGQTACKNLAQRDPLKALMNSDNLQYFAENNPRLS